MGVIFNLINLKDELNLPLIHLDRSAASEPCRLATPNVQSIRRRQMIFVEKNQGRNRGPYNTCEELDQLVAALLRIQAGRGQRRA